MCMYVLCSSTRLDNMAIGEDDPAALIDDKAGGIASTGSLSVEGATCGGPQNDDGGDDLGEGLPPVLRRRSALFERRVDLHAQFVLNARSHGLLLRSQSLHRIAHGSLNRREFWGRGFIEFNE